MKITNNSAQPQGVHGVERLVFIRPGQTRDVELSESGLAQARALPFLTIEGDEPQAEAVEQIEEPAAEVAPEAKSDQLDHDGDGRKGGSLPKRGK